MIALQDYEGVVQYANALTQEEYSEQVMYCVSNAYAQLGDFEKAERAAVASLSIEEDLFKIHGLARLYYDQKKYDKAYAMYTWGREQIEEKMRRGEIVDGPKNIPSINYPLAYMKKKVYSEFIDTLLMLDDYDQAGEIYKEYCLIREAKDKQEVLLKIEKSRELFEAKQEVDHEKHQLELEVIHRDKTIQNMVELQKNWCEDLLKCQVFDEKIEITDDMWDHLSMDTKMDLIIQKVRDQVTALGAEGYDVAMEKVKSRYPDMPMRAQRYLASAEQLYHVFGDNPLLDSAPVLLEFSRVFEECLWNYIDHSAYYKEGAEQQLRNRRRTLGTAGYIIRNNDGPLMPYAAMVQEITKMRNESAHAYVSKEPEIRTIRELIWKEQDNLLDALFEMQIEGDS